MKLVFFYTTLATLGIIALIFINYEMSIVCEEYNPETEQCTITEWRHR